MVLTDIILSLLKSNILMKEQEVMKSGFKKRLAALLSCALVLGMGMETSAAGTRVSDDGTMVSLVNGFRATGADCDQVGFMGPSQALAVDSYLTELAMQRAEEIAVNFSHTRPDGSMVTTAGLCEGENIAMGTGLGANGAFQLWREDNKSYDGQGHRRNMLEPGYVAIGIGHVQYNGEDYWVQEFGRTVRGGTPAPVEPAPEQPTPEDPTQPAPEEPAGPQYSFTGGAGAAWTPGSSDPLVITCDGDFSKFAGITIDGAAVDPSNYDAWSGSTVVSLKPEFLQSLSVGTHIYRVNYTDGAAETSFTIENASAAQPGSTNSGNKSPRTGESTPVSTTSNSTVILSIVMLIALSGAAVTGMKLRKRA